MSEQQNFRVVSSKPLPEILIRELDRSNEELLTLQRKLQDSFTKSTREIMNIMNLREEDGWVLDVENRRFVLLAVDETAETPSEDE